MALNNIEGAVEGAMETTILGLPFMTVAVSVGVPASIIGLLVWWGVSYRDSENEEGRIDGGMKDEL